MRGATGCSSSATAAIQRHRSLNAGADYEMRLVDDRGGEYVFCDTDRLFIVATESDGLIPCPGGPHPMPDGDEAVLALSWAQVRDVADQLGRLNPYGPPLDTEPLLKVEQENFDPSSGLQWQLFCESIASKRYAGFRYDRDGRPVLVDKPGRYKRSEPPSQARSLAV